MKFKIKSKYIKKPYYNNNNRMYTNSYLHINVNQLLQTSNFMIFSASFEVG